MSRWQRVQAKETRSNGLSTWRARKEGNVPKSQDLGSSILLLIGVILWDNYGGQIATHDPIDHRPRRDGLNTKASSRTKLVILRQVIQASVSVLPLMAGLVFTSLVVHFAQVGPLWLRRNLVLIFKE